MILGYSYILLFDDECLVRNWWCDSLVTEGLNQHGWNTTKATAESRRFGNLVLLLGCFFGQSLAFVLVSCLSSVLVVAKFSMWSWLILGKEAAIINLCQNPLKRPMRGSICPTLLTHGYMYVLHRPLAETDSGSSTSRPTQGEDRPLLAADS